MNLAGMKSSIFLKFFPLILPFIVLAFVHPFLPAYYSSLLASVLCWIGLAVSWHFFSGVTKYISLGSAAFFGIGIYITALFGRILPFPAVLLSAGVLCFLFALGVGLVTLRLKGIYFAIFTLGLAFLLDNTTLFWEMKVTGTRGRWITPIDIYYPILIITFVIILLTTALRRSKLGLALKMIGECEDAAIHFGVDTTLYKTLGFAISSMCIGFLGAAYAPRWGYIDSSIAFHPLYAFMPVIMTLFGGIGTAFGPVLGAGVLSLLEEYLLTAFREYFMVIFGLIMILVILFLPEGIAGKLLKKERALGAS